MRFGISLSDFLFLNKDVNTNCTNLLADYSYCVKPVGDSEFALPELRSMADPLKSTPTVVDRDISMRPGLRLVMAQL